MNETVEIAPVSEEADAQVSGPGAHLRRLREARSLSREAVAEQLHLDLRILVALEEDRYEALPAPVFVRGYLRQYARLLEVDAEPLLAAYRPPPDDAPPRRPARRRPRLRMPAWRLPWRRLFVVLLLLVLAWVGWRYGADWVAAWRARQAADAGDRDRPGEATLPLPPPSP
ncbi:MAG: hypothetical protein D6721_03840 [Gammaproteobacteria bacterium]|nr:MAG: hypothetical protein D6721_03840 [Gammaproteobacteria bacterium]